MTGLETKAAEGPQRVPLPHKNTQCNGMFLSLMLASEVEQQKTPRHGGRLGVWLASPATGGGCGTRLDKVTVG